MSKPDHWRLIERVDRLKELVDAATPGPWLFDDSDEEPMVFTMNDYGMGGTVAAPPDAYPRGINHPKESMRFIATFDPTVVQIFVHMLRQVLERHQPRTLWQSGPIAPGDHEDDAWYCSTCGVWNTGVGLRPFPCLEYLAAEAQIVVIGESAGPEFGI